MKLTGGEGGAHDGSGAGARVVIKRRPQLISVLGELEMSETLPPTSGLG
jgi:hypothetical protein